MFLKDRTARHSVSADVTSPLVTVRSSSEHTPNAGAIDKPGAGTELDDAAELDAGAELEEDCAPGVV